MGWLAHLTGSTRFESREACAADLSACTDDCLTRQKREACLSLAETLEAEEDRVHARTAYALSCALGVAAGCTTRGGGIRNVPLPDDPQSRRPDPERFTCLARTFRAGCEGGDSWGCTMFGQAHEFGEGVPQDAGQARIHYHMACNLADDPAFDACVWAGYGLERLGR